MISEKMFRLNKNGEPYCDCYCRNPELIENYEKAIADTTQTWDVHHKMEKYFPQKTLKAIGWYYDCEPEELIFLTPSEHHKIDSCSKRQSEAMKNHKNLSKKVLCVETEEKFESARDAERKTGINNSNISKTCRGIYKTSGGYHWKFV